MARRGRTSASAFAPAPLAGLAPPLELQVGRVQLRVLQTDGKQ